MRQTERKICYPSCDKQGNLTKVDYIEIKDKKLAEEKLCQVEDIEEKYNISSLDDLEKRLIVLQILNHLLNSEKCKNMYRLSKEEYNNEKESNSIINQKQIIDNYLKEHKEYKLVDYYVDDGYSGTNFDRPEFQRM